MDSMNNRQRFQFDWTIYVNVYIKKLNYHLAKNNDVINLVLYLK